MVVIINKKILKSNFNINLNDNIDNVELMLDKLLDGNKFNFFFTFFKFRKPSFKDAIKSYTKKTIDFLNSKTKTLFNSVFIEYHYIYIKDNSFLSKYLLKYQYNYNWYTLYIGSKPADHFYNNFPKDNPFNTPEEGFYNEIGMPLAEKIHGEKFGSRVILQLREFDWPRSFPNPEILKNLRYKEYEDLPFSKVDLDQKTISHGARTLGILLADGYLGTGICPRVKLIPVVYESGDFPCTIFCEMPEFIDSKMPKIILFEQDLNDNKPLVSINVINEYINNLVKKGITVIIPAGNGKLDIGNINSEAILVGATKFQRGEKNPSIKNYGEAVSTMALGEYLISTDIEVDGNWTKKYTYGFHKETSGASALVAGICVAIQDAMIKKHSCSLKPNQLKKLLFNNHPGLTKFAMPNLGEIVEKIYSCNSCQEVIKYIDGL